MIEGGKRLQPGAQKQPRVTIITVVYNAVAFVEDFLQNTAAYRSDDVELVILDGNSTDGTLNLLQQHNDKIDYWRSEPDNGIYDAMNQATQYAKGQWLYFMGADDRLLGGFRKMIPLLIDRNTVYYAKVILWGEERGKPYNGYDFVKIEMCHQSIFYPAHVFDYHQYKTEYKILADQYLNISCFADSRFKWQFANNLVAIYDTRGYSANKEDTLYVQHYNQIVRKNLGLWIYLKYRFRKFKLNRKERK